MQSDSESKKKPVSPPTATKVSLAGCGKRDAAT
jgi:hypothetical protein